MGQNWVTTEKRTHGHLENTQGLVEEVQKMQRLKLDSIFLADEGLIDKECRTCAASWRSSTLKCNGYISGKYGETRNFLSLSGEKWCGSRHLVFWSVGTLTGLRDWVRRLVA